MMLVIEKITLMVELYPLTVSLALLKRKLFSVFHNSWKRTIFGNGKCTNLELLISLNFSLLFVIWAIFSQINLKGHGLQINIELVRNRMSRMTLGI